MAEHVDIATFLLNNQGWEYRQWTNGSGVGAIYNGIGTKKAVCTFVRKSVAEFILDAFTVASETGLSPRQLVEQRDKAIKDAAVLAKKSSDHINHLQSAYNETRIRNDSLVRQRDKALAAMKRIQRFLPSDIITRTKPEHIKASQAVHSAIAEIERETKKETDHAQ